MMDPENLQSDLLALRRLYGLLINDEHYVEDAGSENLDKNARQVLINLLNDASNKAFAAHANILGTQYRATYSPWSMPQGRSRDGLNLQQPFSLRNAPTDGGYPSLQEVEFFIGQDIISEPTDQVDLLDELSMRMKRCRVCRKPKAKQLTKEISFGGSKALTSINRLQNQNHKRRWEVENDPNITDQEDQISREASTKILQIESCISSLQVAAKHPSFFKKVNEKTSQIMTPSSQKMIQQIGEPVANKTDMYNQIKKQYDYKPEEAYHPLQSDEISSNLENTVDKNRFLRRNLSSQIKREQFDQLQMGKKEATRSSEMTEWRDPPVGYGRPKNEEQEAKSVERKKPVKPNDDQTDRYRRKDEVVDADHKKLVSAATKGLSDIPVSNPNYLTHSQSTNSSSDGEGSSEMNSVPNQDQNSYKKSSLLESLGSMLRRTDPKKDDTKGPKRKTESKMNPTSIQEEGPSMSSTSSESSRSERVHKKGHQKDDQKEPKKKSDSKINAVSSQDKRADISSSTNKTLESNLRPIVSKNDNPKELKRKSESKANSVSSEDQSPFMSSSSNESSGSRTVRKKGHQKGDQKEPKKKSENKMNVVSSRDKNPDMSSNPNKTLESNLKQNVPKKGNPKELKGKSESKMNRGSSEDQSPSMSSSSNESSGSRTVRKRGPKKGDQKEPKRKSKGKINKGSSQDQNTDTSSSSSESSWSGSGKVVPKRGNQKINQKEPKRKTAQIQDQSSDMSSSSSESSGSSSRANVVPKKGYKKINQKEQKRKTVSSQDQSPDISSSSSQSSRSSSRTGSSEEGNQDVLGFNQLGKLKDKLSVIFQQQHHHHHHHYHPEKDIKKGSLVLWKGAKKVIGQGRKAVKKIEAHGEKAVKNINARRRRKKAERKANAHSHGEHLEDHSHGEHEMNMLEGPHSHGLGEHETNMLEGPHSHGHEEQAPKLLEGPPHSHGHGEHDMKLLEGPPNSHGHGDLINMKLLEGPPHSHGHVEEHHEMKRLEYHPHSHDHVEEHHEIKRLEYHPPSHGHVEEHHEVKRIEAPPPHSHGHGGDHHEVKLLAGPPSRPPPPPPPHSHGHGEHAVKMLAGHPPHSHGHGEHEAKKIDYSKALVVHKGAGEKEKKKSGKLPSLGGLLKKTKILTKTSMSKSSGTSTSSSSGGQKLSSIISSSTSGSSGKKGMKMPWMPTLQTLRAKRAIKRIDKLHGKLDRLSKTM